ncbi:MATE family efflux transporter [Rhodococcus sp. RS1C4]|uniref:MATE family efflux transporter n=1 Tax=Rhodococcoides fascians TaxID=1828 RepID=UPI000564A06D|nr:MULTISPECIES: MATE family efflux transporter [Rhodococcus]OZC45036.1 MATE family efflux transporter [Rhodococcus sp. RS1C4]OZC54158.1 MATE family efflux transporter [Rhodococcus sp. 06-621-2]OZD68375.1 MATE family efflux transporter [Rhodococcus sp. 06-1059B-a]OZE76893.1 MATE family efflux transporter [Rhodococcus sp. 15-649-1-2]OZE98938.1 MATE family efflux transporter [Rhodococcus sp. 15-1154-1]
MPSGDVDASQDASPRRILGLALPALGVLAAEPLYLLFDAAVVGRLGAAALAGLAVGGLVLAQVSTQLTFLSYGTTARAARMHGAGRERDAVGEGAQATWLALILGTVIVGVMQMLCVPILTVIGGGGDITAQAVQWFRVAVLGVPFILVSLAGNGWMRGVQNTVRPLRFVLVGLGLSAVLCPLLVHGLAGFPDLGLVGSAVANVVGQAVSGAFFVAAVVRSGVPLRPSWSIMRAQLVLGRDLVLRSLAFQACFLSAAAVASRFGAASVAANQVVLHMWNLVSLTLDSLAIAAQTLVGAALGRGDVRGATRLGWRLTVWSTIFAAVLAGVFAVGRPVIPALFTTDGGVVAEMHSIWWIFVVIVPIAGVVFALDGVLLGAGDAAFLRTATLACALIGFLPAIWMALAFDWGLRGIWFGLGVFVTLRMIAVVVRTLSGKWALVGADIQREAG